MQPEIEAKFLDVDQEYIRGKLLKLGAELQQPVRLMRRTLFDYPDRRLQNANWGRLRVRDEGDKVTVAFKDGGEEGYSNELETTVGSYDKMVELFKVVGLEAIVFQESKRETWHFQHVEIVLDEWPYLRPYIEVEAATEGAVRDCVEKLGLKWQDSMRGNVDTAYRHQYPGMTADETINAMPELRFSTLLPEWLAMRQQAK